MPNLPEFTRLDQLPRTVPLGLRFWDAATQTIIGGGLKVTAAPKLAVLRPGPGLRTVDAQPNSSGIYVLHKSPYGTEPDFSFGKGDDIFWALNSESREVEISVYDLEGRFVPVQFTVGLPQRGLYSFECPGMSAGLDISPPPETVPLFSAAARTRPTGAAVVRADLKQVDGKTPAAWAVLEIFQEIAGTSIMLASGISDIDGHLVVFFPYPVPEDDNGGAVIGSIPGMGAVPLHLQQWQLSFKVYFNEGADQLKAPDLCEIFSQSLNALRADLSLHDVLDAQTLTYGQECILRTSGYSWVVVGY